MEFLRNYIESHPEFKTFVFKLMMPSIRARPRWWVRNLVNPFVHKIHRKAFISSKARLDVLPSKAFEIGANSLIEDFSVINNGVGAVHIGTNSVIGLHNVLIGPLRIEDNVILAQNIVISALNHKYENPNIAIKEQGVETFPILVESGVWIGANVVITAGVKIGKQSIVGAGSVVTKDIPAYCVAVGNPARIVRKYNFDTAKWEKQ